MLSRKDFLKYVSTPVDNEGNTAYMLDEAKVDSNARMQDDLLKAFLRFTGGDYASLAVWLLISRKFYLLELP